MIKGLAITPPVIGRISIGRVVEKNGKRLPEKDDQFTLTSQLQNRDGWILHPLDETLRKAANGKLRALPVRLLFNDPVLNLRAAYTLFDRETGRAVCVGDGQRCRRLTEGDMVTLDCPGADTCHFGQERGCRPYARFNVVIGDEDELGSFIFRTSSYNSIRTLCARLHYYHAASGGHLASLPLELRLRGKSTTQSFRTPIYYVDLVTRSGTSLSTAIQEARETHERRVATGFDQLALDAAAGNGLACGAFEEGPEDIHEFLDVPGESTSDHQSIHNTQDLCERAPDSASSRKAGKAATLHDKLEHKAQAIATS